MTKRPMRAARAALAFAALGTLTTLAACEFDARAIGTGRAQTVVHAVLNPGAGEYVVLLERTLTGRIDTRASVHDPADPIVSGNGDAISGARVELSRIDDGSVRVAVGAEDAEVRNDRKGAGVYRFVNIPCGPFGCPANFLPISRGGRYRLRVTLPGGDDIIEGETTVPVPQLLPATPGARFDRERDTIRLRWPAATSAHRYVLQIQTPFGPFQLFSDTNTVTLTGGLRNFMVQRLPLVFTPGFGQAVQIAAVDTNYYDYYHSANDPFTGSGLLSHLRGGTGVFGSYASIRRDSLEVVAPQDELVEGTFADDGDRLMLYATGTELVSGRWDTAAGTRHGVLGTRQGNRLRIVVLAQTTVNDTAFVGTADVVADTLILRSRTGDDDRRMYRVR